MNKKNYFYLLWVLSSIPTVVGVVLTFATEQYLNEIGPRELAASTGIVFSVALGILGIIFHGFLLTIGLHFAEKIGAPLLLLNGNYDLKKDILKPAIIVGVVVSCIVFAINIALPFELFSALEGISLPFDKIWIILPRLVVYDTGVTHEEPQKFEKSDPMRINKIQEFYNFFA